MITPQYAQYEYVNAQNLNAAAGAVSGSLAQFVSGSLLPGIIRPDVVAITYPGGLIVNVAAPLPSQFAFGTGILASAHGTQTGTDTSSYSVNFSGVVPVSGIATIYLAAQASTVQENPYQVIGPPPGHPDYNPNFQPYTAYATILDTLTLIATAMAPDNINTLEIARGTLAAGATGIAALTTLYQQRAAPTAGTRTQQLSGTQFITPSLGGFDLQLIVSGTYTLPPVSGSNGLSYFMSATVSGCLVQTASGSELIYGLTPNQATGIVSFIPNVGANFEIFGEFGRWQIRSTPIGSLVTALVAGPGIAINQSSGIVEITNAGVTANITGNGIAIDVPTGASTIGVALKSLWVREQQPPGGNSANGTMAANTWVQRVLNTVMQNSILGAGLNAGNQIVLPSGTYLIDVVAPVVLTGGFSPIAQARVWNATTNAAVAFGTVEGRKISGPGFIYPIHNTVKCIFSTTGGTLEIDQFIVTGAICSGGNALNAAGGAEVYTEVMILKIG